MPVLISVYIAGTSIVYNALRALGIFARTIPVLSMNLCTIDNLCSGILCRYNNVSIVYNVTETYVLQYIHLRAENFINEASLLSTKMTELTQSEKALLSQIVNDKYSVGAFAGMIFNATVGTTKSPESAIKEALQVRLAMEKLAE